MGVVRYLTDVGRRSPRDRYSVLNNIWKRKALEGLTDLLLRVTILRRT